MFFLNSLVCWCSIVLSKLVSVFMFCLVLLVYWRFVLICKCSDVLTRLIRVLDRLVSVLTIFCWKSRVIYLSIGNHPLVWNQTLCQSCVESNNIPMLRLSIVFSEQYHADGLVCTPRLSMTYDKRITDAASEIGSIIYELYSLIVAWNYIPVLRSCPMCRQKQKR